MPKSGRTTSRPTPEPCSKLDLKRLFQISAQLKDAADHLFRIPGRRHPDKAEALWLLGQTAKAIQATIHELQPDPQKQKPKPVTC